MGAHPSALLPIGGGLLEVPHDRSWDPAACFCWPRARDCRGPGAIVSSIGLSVIGLAGCDIGNPRQHVLGNVGLSSTQPGAEFVVPWCGVSFVDSEGRGKKQEVKDVL